MTPEERAFFAAPWIGWPFGLFEPCPFAGRAESKGELRTTLHPRRLLKERYGAAFPLLEEYQNGGNAILCRPGALGWFRQNGFYADVLIGADSEALLQALQPPALNAVWEE